MCVVLEAWNEMACSENSSIQKSQSKKNQVLKQKWTKLERKAEPKSGGLCGPRSHGVLSCRKGKPLKESKPGNENIGFAFQTDHYSNGMEEVSRLEEESPLCESKTSLGLDEGKFWIQAAGRQSGFLLPPLGSCLFGQVPLPFVDLVSFCIKQIIIAVKIK